MAKEEMLTGSFPNLDDLKGKKIVKIGVSGGDSVCEATKMKILFEDDYVIHNTGDRPLQLTKVFNNILTLEIKFVSRTSGVHCQLYEGNCNE